MRTATTNYAELKLLMPHTATPVLKEAAAVPNASITVYVTTLPTSESLSFCLRKIYAQPWFNVIAVMPNDSPANFIHYAKTMGASVMLYPSSVAGNLHNIRKWIESVGTPPYIISDDDPGSSFAGSGYRGNKARVIIPIPGTKTGAMRLTVSAEALCFLWNTALFFGKQAGCDYVGLNNSEQQLSSLPGYETTGKTPKRSFGTYGYKPFNYGSVITGACAVLNPCRTYVHPSLHNMKQEWATASVESNANHGGTFMLMPVIVGFAVKPPKDVASDMTKLCTHYPNIVKQGNTAGGRLAFDKTGCIIHLTTKKAYTNPRQ